MRYLESDISLEQPNTLKNQYHQLYQNNIGSLNFSGHSTPVSISDIVGINNKSSIPSQLDLQKLSSILISGMNKEPYIKTNSLNQRRFSRKKRTFEIELENSHKTLNSRFENYGPQKVVKDNFKLKFQRNKVNPFNQSFNNFQTFSNLTSL